MLKKWLANHHCKVIKNDGRKVIVWLLLILTKSKVITLLTMFSSWFCKYLVASFAILWFNCAKLKVMVVLEVTPK